MSCYDSSNTFIIQAFKILAATKLLWSNRKQRYNTFPIEITDLHIICLAVVICLGHSAQPGEGMWYQGFQYFLKFFTLLVPSWKVFTILKHKTFVLHFPNQSFPLVKIRVLYKQVPGLATVQYSF